MKLLFFVILPTVLIIHIGNSVIIKINPIKVQVRTNSSENNITSPLPTSYGVEFQHRSIADQLTITQNMRPTDFSREVDGKAITNITLPPNRNWPFTCKLAKISFSNYTSRNAATSHKSSASEIFPHNANLETTSPVTQQHLFMKSSKRNSPSAEFPLAVVTDSSFQHVRPTSNQTMFGSTSFPIHSNNDRINLDFTISTESDFINFITNNESTTIHSEIRINIPAETKIFTDADTEMNSASERVVLKSTTIREPRLIPKNRPISHLSVDSIDGISTIIQKSSNYSEPNALNSSESKNKPNLTSYEISKSSIISSNSIIKSEFNLGLPEISYLKTTADGLEQSNVTQTSHFDSLPYKCKIQEPLYKKKKLENLNLTNSNLMCTHVTKPSNQHLATSIPLEEEDDEEIAYTVENYTFQQNNTISNRADDSTISANKNTFSGQVEALVTTVEKTENDSGIRLSNTTEEYQVNETDRATNDIFGETTREIRFKSSIDTESQTSSSEFGEKDQDDNIFKSSTSGDSTSNVSENPIAAFHWSLESKITTESRFDQSNLNKTSPTATSAHDELHSAATYQSHSCKTVHTNRTSFNPYSCKTVHIHRTTTPKALSDAEKNARRLTISNKNPELAKKLTKVKPLKGNVSSNAGFLMVNRKYGARLFFWFVRSQKDASHAPVIVWLQGQPGWSSLFGLFEEHGPYRVVETGNEIHFELREQAWTNEFNVLYLDHCIGCGYSTAKRKIAYKPTYEMVGANVYRALIQFFKVFDEYAANDVYLAGEHGCAKYIPIIADEIHAKNQIEEEQINLKGALIGGPYVDTLAMSSYSNYLYMIGLIDENELENLFIKEQSAKALILASKYNETIDFLKQYLYSKIERAGFQRLYDLRYEKPVNGKYTFERYMQKVVQYEPFIASIHAEGLEFRIKSELLIEDIMKPIDHILTNILKHYKVLYYNGQFDMLTPYSLTAEYFSTLKWTETDSFYSSQLENWHATGEEFPNGYWKFSSNLTHLLIRNAGHTVGTTQPKALLHLLKWFVENKFETTYSPPSPDQRYLNVFI